MLINMEEQAFFGTKTCIKYLTAWDNLFSISTGTRLNFYPYNPANVVNITLFAERGNIKEENILISLGKYHNNKDAIDKLLTGKEQQLVDICNATDEFDFAFDLNKMRIVEYEDFTDENPRWGINSLFVFNNDNSQQAIKCLVNASSNVFSNDIFLAWFLSYIASTKACLMPKDKIEDVAKIFLQAVSGLFYSPQRKVATNNISILNCSLSDGGSLYYKIPGKTDRLGVLLGKSLEQIKKQKEKQKRKSRTL